MEYLPDGTAIFNTEGNKETTFDTSRSIRQDLSNGAALTIREVHSGAQSVEKWNGANTLRGASGRWVRRLTTDVETNFGLTLPGDYPLGFSRDGSKLYVTEYFSDRSMIRVYDTASKEMLPGITADGVLDEATGGPVFSGLSGDRAIWLSRNGQLRHRGCDRLVLQPQAVPYMRAVEAFGTIYLVLSIDEFLFTRPFDSLDGWQTPTRFIPALLESYEDHLLLGGTTGAGQHGDTEYVHLFLDIHSARAPYAKSTPDVTLPSLPEVHIPVRDLAGAPYTDVFWAVGREKPDKDGNPGKDDQGFTLDQRIAECRARAIAMGIYRDGRPFDPEAETLAQFVLAHGVPVLRFDCGYPDPHLSEQDTIDRYPVNAKVVCVLACFMHADWGEQKTVNITVGIFLKCAAHGIAVALFGAERSQSTVTLRELHTRLLATPKTPVQAWPSPQTPQSHLPEDHDMKAPFTYEEFVGSPAHPDSICNKLDRHYQAATGHQMAAADMGQFLWTMFVDGNKPEAVFAAIDALKK